MSLQATNVEALLHDLRQCVKFNRVRVEEAFRDHDKLRKGFITEPQFAACVGSLKFPRMHLQPQHITMLCEYYGEIDPQHGTKRVPYMRFVQDTDEAAALKNLERNPQHPIPFDEAPRAPRNDLTPDEWNRFEAAQQKFVQQTISRGLSNSLKEPFKDFDRHSCGRVSSTQFKRCFPFPADDITMNLLVKRYLNPANGDVTYLAWVQDVEGIIARVRPGLALAKNDTLTAQAQAQAQAYGGTSGGLSPTKRPGRMVFGVEFPSAEEVEQAIIDHCFARRVRIHEPMRDFDPLRAGVMTRGNFASALSIAGVLLDSAELEALYGKYGCVQQGSDGPQVRWLEFADYIDSVFTKKGMEKDPFMTFQATSTLTPGTRSLKK